MYFSINKETLKIIGHYKEFNQFGYDGCYQAQLEGVTITEEIINWGNDQTSIKYTYSDLTLPQYKQLGLAVIERPVVDEITLPNGLIFDDTQESINYLIAKTKIVSQSSSMSN